ncbi:hypothetical protein [Kitasatospora sp. A2-31]|uniref:hypothetical protein n=1 Tax=Kitasatospora sp. A2-31 TaxID=2916414 RepID=UPI001EEA46EC|nr:hypothetical protein [Kitasatospora sp. A2-31]MCG6497903.1 hypothetical protein [Kitasatospora sp. A2-31]
MNRIALIAAGVAGAATLLAAPQAGAATATATATTVTCGSSGLQAGLSTKVCAEITGDQVQLYGQISLAGPPSPGSPAPQPQELITGLSGQVVGGASLGSVNGYTQFTASTVQVRGVGGTVACGSTVHASFSVAKFPWNPAPVTLDVVVPC